MEISESFKEKVEKIKEKAKKYGASKDLMKLLDVQKDVILPHWPHIKCSFGCKNYGESLCCPPYIPEPDEWREFLKDYKYALIIGFKGIMNVIFKNQEKLNKNIFRLERKAFLMGFHKAFIFFPGYCMLCKKCIVKEDDFPKGMDPKLARRLCKHLDKARPSMEATGIDVFGTIRNAGLELKVVSSENDKVVWYTMLLLE